MSLFNRLTGVGALASHSVITGGTTTTAGHTYPWVSGNPQTVTIGQQTMMQLPREQRVCKNCQHWKETGDTQILGQCHRLAPQVLFDPRQNDFVTRFPDTTAAMGCGEFED